MSQQYCLVFCTCPDAPSAERLANDLVAEHLAACVNILPGITSIYPWEGKIENSREHLLLIKSRESAYAALEASIRKSHPYELPEIISVPFQQGQSDYLKWIDAWVKS
jgi:periplasmic divalent cation tolerance protein